MNTKNLFLTAICFILANLPIIAQEGFVVKDFNMAVAGTSTLHDWESDVTQLDATAHLDFSNGQLNSIERLKVSVPAKSIVSSKGRIMDNKTYDALKADKYPTIEFRLDKATVDGSNITAYGKLSIAGQSRQVTLKATGKTGSNGNITFSGSKAIKMTDYGMEPPTALLGTVTTGDEVTISYELTLTPTGQDSGTH